MAFSLCLDLGLCQHGNSSTADETKMIIWLVSDFTACIVFMQRGSICLLIQKKAAVAGEVIKAASNVKS